MKRKAAARRVAGRCRHCRAGASGGKRVLRIQLRRFLRALPRDPQELRCLARVQPSRRIVRRLPRGDYHARRGLPCGKSAAPGTARAAGVCRPGAFGCSRYSAIDGTMPRVPPAGVRPVAIGGPQCDLRAAVRGCTAQSEASVERRLPALPRHAFRRRHTGPGGAGGYQGSMASAAARTGGPAGDPVPELPPGASRGRDVARARHAASKPKRRRRNRRRSRNCCGLRSACSTGGNKGTSPWSCCRCPPCGTARAP